MFTVFRFSKPYVRYSQSKLAAVPPNRKLGRSSANRLWIHTKLATSTRNPVFLSFILLGPPHCCLQLYFFMTWWSIKSLFAASLNIFPQNVLKQNAHKQKRKTFSGLLQFAREHLTKKQHMNSQKKLISQSCAMLTWSLPKQKQAQQPTAMGNSLSGAYTVYVQIQRTPPPPPKEAQNCWVDNSVKTHAVLFFCLLNEQKIQSMIPDIKYMF